jgi:hypothetical protein
LKCIQFQRDERYLIHINSLLKKLSEQLNITQEDILRSMLYSRYRTGKEHEELEPRMRKSEAQNSTKQRVSLYVDSDVFALITKEYDVYNRQHRITIGNYVRNVLIASKDILVRATQEPEPEPAPIYKWKREGCPVGDGFQKWKYQRNGRSYNK